MPMTCFVCADSVYFSIGYYEEDASPRTFGLVYNITYFNITYNPALEELNFEKLFGVRDDDMWLRCKA